MSALDGIPYGWRFIPIEANDDMCDAGVMVIETIMRGDGAPFKFPDIEHLYDIFAAMLNAAPQPTEEELQTWSGEINVDKRLFNMIETMATISAAAFKVQSENLELRYKIGLLENKIDHLERKSPCT